MLKAIIFDIDGVLVDSREANVDFYQKLFVKAGYSKPSRKEILDLFHLPLRESIEVITGVTDQVEVQRIWEMARDDDSRDASLLKFPERLEEILEHLHKNYRLAIVTSRIRVGVDFVFTAKEIKHYFDVVVAYEDYNNPKPHPEPLLVALQKLQVTTKEAIYIGDSDTDIEAAKAAQVESIHLSASPHPDASAAVQEFEGLIGAIESVLVKEKP